MIPERLAIEETARAEELLAERRFRGIPRVRVRFLQRDVYGMDSLSRVSEELLA
jgi:hypothetical protein